MIDWAALGLPLQHNIDEYDMVIPLEVLVVARGLDAGDNIRYWMIKTPHLHNTEARNMANFALEVCKK